MSLLLLVSHFHVVFPQMGPSGSGKTTLLDVLAGRKTAGEILGSITFAGRKPSKMFLRRYTGYVEQFDTLLDMLTVEEMLMYTAELKRPVEEPLGDKRAEVERLLEKLALAPAKNTRIGNALHRGISGGQAKRVNVAIALITDPRVLFLDEPTSGLDSYTANEVRKLTSLAYPWGGCNYVDDVGSPCELIFWSCTPGDGICEEVCRRWCDNLCYHPFPFSICIFSF